MTTLLTRVKSRLFVHTRRSSRTLLEGEWASVFHGRSLDYDDLREYIVGDEVRDIDWKASARHNHPLVKRYVANRKQNVLFVVDSGRGMAARTLSGETKGEIAVMAVGLIGYLTLRHGDLVAIAHGDARDTSLHSLRGSEAHLELMLQELNRSVRLDGPPSALMRTLDYLAQHYKRRTILVVISDDGDLGPGLEPVLRRLKVQHDILWITVADADPTEIDATTTAYDVLDDYTLPTEVRLDPKVHQAYTDEINRRRARHDEQLNRLSINHTRVSSTQELTKALFTLLERQRRAR